MALVDRHIAQGGGPRDAIRALGRTLSYDELQRWVARSGNALRELRVLREDRVALILLDSPEFIATFLGAVSSTPGTCSG